MHTLAECMCTLALKHMRYKYYNGHVETDLSNLLTFSFVIYFFLLLLLLLLLLLGGGEGGEGSKKKKSFCSGVCVCARARAGLYMLPTGHLRQSSGLS